ncbi:PP2C family serine/threonine-protein phosphatase [Dactylosporangium sp. AC04546]|uniref:PP2C family serine/threonine-protein phosphatase n=1 Tax=Dactylosporangium sp. AC04546 TaxID=2862460 RepID=UPI001EDD3E42|nr:PP2C family serine/threonine-protein phosphatase [Dactylosporangium sp. AC04546]WVK84203.1 PP2C family serine/threonine-protein phosphatase [Dactylosporangium sp. AC04546]
MTGAAAWRFAAAARPGTGHTREGLPCQDRYGCEVVPSPYGPVLVAIVSDGAGSAVEGERGAELICTELLDEIRRRLADVVPAGTDWLRACVAVVRRRLLAEAERLGLPPRQLAATLLCAVLAPDWSTFAQIGDGAIVTPELGTGAWAWMFWPQRGEYANTTSFLTDPTALERLEADSLPHGQDEVALFTDGLQHLVLDYGAQRVHDPFFDRILGPVRRSSAQGEDHTLSTGLEAYLGSPPVVSRTDDDLTLVLASRVTEPADLATTH